MSNELTKKWNEEDLVSVTGNVRRSEKIELNVLALRMGLRPADIIGEFVKRLLLKDQQALSIVARMTKEKVKNTLSYFENEEETKDSGYLEHESDLLYNMIKLKGGR